MAETVSIDQITQIRRAFDALSTRLLVADCLGQTFDELGGDDTPPWVFVYRQHVGAAVEAAQALENLLSRLPLRAPHPSSLPPELHTPNTPAAHGGADSAGDGS